MKRLSIQALIAICVSALALLSECNNLSAQSQATAKMEDIIQASRIRQERTRSLYINLTQRITDAKGSRSLPKELSPQGKEETIPPRDITYDSHTQLWIDGEKIRYAFDNHQWSREEQNLIPLPMITTFDGKLLKMLFTKTGPDKPHPSGSIEKKSRHYVSDVVYLRPIFMTFRALDSKMLAFDMKQMTLTGRRLQIGNHNCLELQSQDPTAGAVYYQWVDPSRDFVIPRFMETVGGKLSYQIDVQYRRDNEVGWVPFEWNCIVQFKEGRLRHSVRSKVTVIEVNSSIPKEQFDISFPPGAFIRDFENGESFSLIKENGDKRYLSDNELGIPYQQLISSDPDDFTAQSTTFIKRWWRWISGISLGGLLIVACYVWRKRIKRRRGASTIAE